MPKQPLPAPTASAIGPCPSIIMYSFPNNLKRICIFLRFYRDAFLFLTSFLLIDVTCIKSAAYLGAGFLTELSMSTSF